MRIQQHTRHCRVIKDGARCYELALGDVPVFRARTEEKVPVPTVRDAIGQHTVARVTRRAGYNSTPSYRRSFS